MEYRHGARGLMVLLAVTVGTYLWVPMTSAVSAPGARGRPDVLLTEHLIDDSFGGPSGLDLCDVDRDGLLDVMATDYLGDQIAWWRNGGGDPITWTRYTVGTQFDGAIDVVAGDIDGDLDIDVAGAAWYGHQVAWWENTGGEPIAWTKHVLGSGQTNAHEVCIHDLDGDQDTDIVAAIAGTHSIVWWRNDGNDWTMQTVATGFGGARSVFVCDLDSDGDADVLGAALASNRVTWWRNEGGSPLEWSEFDLSSTYGGAHMVCAHDMDGDGDLDVLAAGYSSPSLCWWRNDGGDPIAWSRQVVDTFPGAVMAYPADFDDDGRPDIVATAQDHSDIVWWHNDGGDPLAWTRHTINDDFGGVWPLSVGDLDGNGTADIAAGGNSAGELRWWKNHPIWLMPAFTADPTTGHAPLQVQFSDQTLAWPPVVSWEWDLDGDGSVDSYDQSPTWEYDQPGDYSITLTTVSDSLAEFCARADYVRVFDGESALRFDGARSVVTCPSTPSLNVTGGFTIEAWIKPSGWGEIQGSGYGRIVDKNRVVLFLSGSSTTYADSSLVLMLFNATGGMSASMTPSGAITLGEWQHVAATYDAAASLAAIYVNGVAQPLEQTRPPTGDITDNAAYDLFIGNAASLGSTFDGAIDELRVWDLARTGDEIRSALSAPLPGPVEGLVGYWPMNEGSGGEILDHSDQANDGIATDVDWVQGTSFEVPTGAGDPGAIPTGTHILHAWPNPFAASTSIAFQSPGLVTTCLTISDLNGRRVRSLDPAVPTTGGGIVMWDGRDGRGMRVPAGVYVIRMDAGAHVAFSRCVVVR